MKRLLATLTSLTMVASLGTVALAIEEADYNQYLRVGGGSREALYFSDDVLYEYDFDDQYIAYGSSFYYPLLTAGSPMVPANTLENEDGEPVGYVEANVMVSDYDYIRGISIRTDWEEGREFAGKPEIVKRKVDGIDSSVSGSVNMGVEYRTQNYRSHDGENYRITDYYAVGNTVGAVIISPGGVAQDSTGAALDLNSLSKSKAEKYYYFLQVPTVKKTNETDTNDLIGTIELRRSGDFGVSGGEVEIDVNVELRYKLSDNMTIHDTETLLEFDDDTEEWIDFEAHPYSYFIINTNGQDDIVAKVTDTYNEDIGDKFPKADLHFFNGNYAVFDRTGELTLSEDSFYNSDELYLYAVDEDGEISFIADSDSSIYDEYEEAFKIKTRTLGVYIISDTELDLVEEAPAVTPAPPTTTVKPNPATGGRA